MTNKSDKPNTHECLYFGRKLSNHMCDDISVNCGDLSIGSENDDQIYFGDCLDSGEEMIKERVSIIVMKDGDNGFLVDIDLEDVLRFASQNCLGIYKRVLSEVEDK